LSRALDELAQSGLAADVAGVAGDLAIALPGVHVAQVEDGAGRKPG